MSPLGIHYRKDNVHKLHAGSQYHGKSVCYAWGETVPQQLNVQEHHPTSEMFVPWEMTGKERKYLITYFVVKSTFGIEEVEKFLVSFTPPKIHVRNLKVAPDWAKNQRWRMLWLEKHSQWHDVYVSPPSALINSMALSLTMYWGYFSMNSITSTIFQSLSMKLRSDKLFTLSHRVGMVSGISYKAIVKP